MGTKTGRIVGRAWPVWRAARSAALLVLLSIVLAFPRSVAAGREDIGGKRSFTTFTQNAYVGADIARVLLLDPTDPNYFMNLLQAVTTTYSEMLASQPRVRMAGIANRIAAGRPDIVALQEMYLLRRQSPGDLALGGQVPATEVVVDFLQSLLDALAARGVHYAVAAATTETDVEMPMFNLQTGGVDDARLTDRDVILVRKDLPPGHLRVSNPRSGNFANHIVIPGVGLSVLRGWCSVDVFVRGERFRYINAHLEEETQPGLQWLQALELLDGPARTALPVILAGDLNTDANRANGTWTYDGLLAAGFADPWNVLRAGAPGPTWGHDPGLADPDWPLVWRIDLVLFKGGTFVPKRVSVVDKRLRRIEPPLWPSDHAGVAAKFLLR